MSRHHFSVENRRTAMHRSTCACLLTTMILAASDAYAADINVPADELTIQAGIDAANPGDVVIVAQGEYFENIDFNGKAITVRSTDPTDAGVVLNTIINGGGSGHVVTCKRAEGSNTILSGFIITGGNADGLGFPIGWGGGMLNNNNSSPTVTNCSFSGNAAALQGGGMANAFNSNPTVTNCTFSGNTAITFNGSSGGGMANHLSNPTVTNCTFSGNAAALQGGGMRNNSGSSPTVTNTGFCDNTSDPISGDFTDGGGNSLLYCPPPFRFCPADLDGDGQVAVPDLLALLAAWGACP